MTQSFHFLVAAAIFSVVFVVTVANPTPTIEPSSITQDAPSQPAEEESDAPSQQAEGEIDAPSQQAEGDNVTPSQQAEGDNVTPSQQAEGESDAETQQAEGESDAETQQAEGETDAETQQAEGESEEPSNKESQEDPAESWHAAEGIMSEAVKTLIKTFSYQLASVVEKNLQTVKDLESHLQTREESLHSNISDYLNSQLDTRDETLQTNISDLKSLYNKLESQLNTTEATLQSKIAGLERAVQQLRARVLPEMGEARLVDGTQNEGFVLVYTGEQLGWGLVCDDDFDNSNVGATIVCKQLGYGNGSFREAEAPSSWVTDRYKIVLDNVKCSSGDTSLTQCRHAELGEHNCGLIEAVRVACSG